ncbi:MAG: hypothetical protein HRT52_02910 [Colwellia sp.]|nr:hypothetical protein [Colwellia sp.]
MNKCKIIYNIIFLWLTLSIVSCGGGGNSDSNVISPPEDVVPPPIETPPAEPESSVYGLYEISVVDSEVMHLLLTAERSYIFSVANNHFPPAEQMCLSNEELSVFSESLLVQTLLFNCTDDEESSITVVIELNNETVTIDYGVNTMIKTVMPLANVIQITTPNFSKLTTGSYSTPIRNDINISRLIAASSRENNIWLNVSSRDTPIGGQCRDSLIFEIDDLSSVQITSTYERVSIPYRSTDSLVGGNCTRSLLPNPSRTENIDVYFYTLANDSYFTVIEQNTFITMGILFKKF